MSILSRIKSGAKKVLKTVKSAFSDAASKFTSGFSNTASAVNAYISGTPKEKAPSLNKSVTGKDSGGTTYYNNNVPNNAVASGYKPVSLSPTPYGPVRQSAGSSTNKVGSGGNKSDTSTSSYNGLFSPAGAGFGALGPSVNTRVSADQISSQRNITNTAPGGGSSVNYESDVKNNNIKVGADVTTGMFQPATAGEDPNTSSSNTTADQSTALDEYLKSIKEDPNLEDAQSKAERRSGVIQARQQMQNTQNAINGITTKMNTDLLKLRGTAAQEGVVEAVYGGQQAQVTREATIKLLPLQAQLAIDQGNVEQAESNLDTLFKIYSSDAQKSVDLWNQKAKIRYDSKSAAEKRKLDEIADQKKFTLNQLNETISMQRKYMSDSLGKNTRLFNALKNIQPPHNINSPTFEQDYQNFVQDLDEAVSKYGQQANPGSSGVLSSLPVSIQGKIVSIANSFGDKPNVKKYIEAVDSVNIVNGIDPKSKNPADHQQIVYAFAKALDPDSAVKEGEYETIKKYAQSTLSKYGKEITNAISGIGFLSETAINNIKTTMNNTLNSRKPVYDNTVKETAKVINNIAGSNVADEIMINYSGGISTQNQNNNQIDYTSTLDSIFN